MTGRKVGRKSLVSPVVRGNVKTTGKNPFPRDLVGQQKTKTARDLLREKQIVEELFDEEWEKNKQRKASLQEFTNLVREKCVLTDRWMVYDPVYDPSHDQTASLVLEMDKTVEGELRIKRCVKVSWKRLLNRDSWVNLTFLPFLFGRYMKTEPIRC